MQSINKEDGYMVVRELGGFWGPKIVEKVPLEEWYRRHPEDCPKSSASVAKEVLLNVQIDDAKKPIEDIPIQSKIVEAKKIQQIDLPAVTPDNNALLNSAKLAVVIPDEIEPDTKQNIDVGIEQMISRHKNNRQEINRLVFESVAAMTIGEDYERQLANKKGLRRFLGGITGSNKKLQDKINSSRAAAQYASQQTLQRLAEQNLMSLDLITAVNNKLNASVIKIEGEINQIYSALLTFFKQSRSDVIQLENRMERLERNVNLLNWQNSIEYQMFDGVEYAELDDTSKIICMVRDFYDITKGEWTTSDLLLLKAAMSSIDILPKEKINYFDFIKAIFYNDHLKQHLLGGKRIRQLPESYLIPLCGIKKLEMFTNEKQYILNTLVGILEERGITVQPEVMAENLTYKYLEQENRVNLNVPVEIFDLVLDLLFNLNQAKGEGLLDSEADDTGKVNSELEKKYQYAVELFKNCKLKEAHPILEELSNCGYGQANALLYWLYCDGYDGLTPNVNRANIYAEKGYRVGDIVSTIQYGLCCLCSRDEQIELFKEYKPMLKELAQSGDVFAIYMLGICYINNTDEPIDYIIAIHYLLEATEKNFYRAFNGMALRYQNGDGVPKDLNQALKWAQKSIQFSDYIKGIDTEANILYDMNRYDEASILYLKELEMGGQCFNRIGYMYHNGQGAPLDYKKAFEYYKKAGESGHSAGYTNMGFMYENGQGVPSDIQKAVEYYMKAAELGECCGQCNLAQCYLNGQGVPYDRAKAKQWLEASAAQGWQRAIDMLRDNF